MIKIGFFDKINKCLIVNTVKNLLQRRDGEIFFTLITQIRTLQ